MRSAICAGRGRARERARARPVRMDISVTASAVRSVSRSVFSASRPSSSLGLPPTLGSSPPSVWYRTESDVELLYSVVVAHCSPRGMRLG